MVREGCRCVRWPGGNKCRWRMVPQTSSSMLLLLCGLDCGGPGCCDVWRIRQEALPRCWLPPADGSRARGLVAKHEEETQDTASHAAGYCMQQGRVARTRHKCSCRSPGMDYLDRIAPTWPQSCSIVAVGLYELVHLFCSSFKIRRSHPVSSAAFLKHTQCKAVTLAGTVAQLRHSWRFAQSSTLPIQALTCHFWVFLNCSNVYAAQRAILEPADAGFAKAVVAVRDVGGVIVQALAPARGHVSFCKLTP